MGLFTRPDSPYWWLWLETAPPGAQKEKTAVRVGTTAVDRRDGRRQAEQVYAQRMTELAARIHRLPTARPASRFDKYAESYARDVIAHRKGATRERELLKVLVAGLGDELLHAIDRERVRAYMTQRRAAGVSARTVNREVDLLKSMLRDAVPKYLESSPLAGMKRLPVTQPKRRLLQPAEEARLLEAATDPQEKALLILGLDTLVRLGDLLDVKRSDRHRGWIYIADSKNEESYQVPLSPRAMAALDAIPKGTGEYYFAKFRQAENPRDWRGSVRQRLEKLCAAAKVPFGKAERGVTFHWATRRTGATRLLVKRRQPVAVVQRLGNWKNPDVLLEIYAEAQKMDLLAAVGSLPKRSRAKRRSA